MEILALPCDICRSTYRSVLSWFLQGNNPSLEMHFVPFNGHGIWIEQVQWNPRNPFYLMHLFEMHVVVVRL
jgi:hypothetical protein